MSKKTGVFWHFLFNFEVFWSLCLFWAILAHQTSYSMFRRSWSIFRHPWHPWGRVNSGVNGFWVHIATVGCHQYHLRLVLTPIPGSWHANHHYKQEDFYDVSHNQFLVEMPLFFSIYYRIFMTVINFCQNNIFILRLLLST